MLQTKPLTTPAPRSLLITCLAALLLLATAGGPAEALGNGFGLGLGAGATESGPECVQEVAAPPLTLSWDELPGEGSSAYTASGELSLRLRNGGDAPLTVSLFLHLRAGGEDLQRPLGTLEVAGAEETALPVVLEMPGVDLRSLALSGRARVRTESRTPEGDLVEHSAAPAVYFHGDPAGGGLWVYDGVALGRDFGGGDLRGTRELGALQRELGAADSRFAGASFAPPVQAGDGREARAQ